jgi:glycosyltransferase involved in cell wall biosynthesis
MTFEVSADRHVPTAGLSVVETSGQTLRVDPREAEPGAWRRRPEQVNLVCLGYNPWSPMWKRNQSLVAELARRPWVRRVLFVNPDVWFGALVRNPRGQLSGLRWFHWKGVKPYRAAANTVVFTMCRWPYAGRSRAIGAFERRLVAAMTGRFTADPYVLLINRPEDPVGPLVASLFERASLRVFDWSDDFEELVDGEDERRRIRERCEFFLRGCDLVLAVNERLARRARPYGRAVEVVRNATHYDILARAASPDIGVAEPLRQLPRPIIGYMGWLNRTRLSSEILEALVAARPSWSFVFLGPTTSDRPLGDRLPLAPNVHILRPVPYERLPHYLAGFDVCILPNRINAYTDGNDPLKLYDYLATGKPIVATRTAGTEGLDEVIRVADDAPSFLAAVEEAVGERGEALRQRRQQLAQQHCWRVRARDVSAKIASMLGVRDPEAAEPARQ